MKTTYYIVFERYASDVKLSAAYKCLKYAIDFHLRERNVNITHVYIMD